MGQNESGQTRTRKQVQKDLSSSMPETTFTDICATVEAGTLPVAPQVPDKFQRLATLGHLEVDKEIARGVSLRGSLQQGGRLWLTCPSNLDVKAKEALWNQSQPLQHFDMFLSHTWLTPGKWKLLSLLLQSGCSTVLLIWSAAMVAATALTVHGELPSVWLMEAHVLDFRAICPVGPWITVASLLATVTGLLVSPYFPGAHGRHDMCFMDLASIHQTDKQLLERGIYGIGGFLRISRELRVLWSAPYLSRLWCVFELAAFRTANPEGKIILAPLFVEAILCLMILWEYFFTSIYWSTRVSQVDEIYSYVAYLFAILPCYFAMHMIRKSHKSKHKLFSDLEQFDLGEVRCSSEFDEDFIHAAIVKWYGGKEAFTEFVRGPLREELLGALASSPLVAYPMLLLSPCVASSLTYLAGLWRGGAPAHCLLSYLMGSFLGFDVAWIYSSISLFLHLCDRYAEPRWPGALDYLQTLLIFLAFAVCFYGGAVLSMWAYTSSIWAAAAWLCFSLLCAGASSMGLPNPRCWGCSVKPRNSEKSSSDQDPVTQPG